MLRIEPQQRKKRAHAALRIEPRVPLPAAVAERGDVVAELRVRERDGIGAVEFEHRE